MSCCSFTHSADTQTVASGDRASWLRESACSHPASCTRLRVISACYTYVAHRVPTGTPAPVDLLPIPNSARFCVLPPTLATVTLGRGKFVTD